MVTPGSFFTRLLVKGVLVEAGLSEEGCYIAFLTSPHLLCRLRVGRTWRDIEFVAGVARKDVGAVPQSPSKREVRGSGFDAFNEGIAEMARRVAGSGEGSNGHGVFQQVAPAAGSRLACPCHAMNRGGVRV